jgi:stearoyl-CoA desaturase (Delta-9 desaturase)
MSHKGKSNDADARVETTKPTCGRYGVQQSEPLWWIKARLIIVHLGSVGIFFLSFHWPLFWLFLISFIVRMWAVEAGYHRYFSHRAFKTSRLFQSILAFLACSTGQRGIIWWAAHHRQHHQKSEKDDDPYGPNRSFWYAHMGWFIDRENLDTDLDQLPDFSRYPELRFLNHRYYLAVIGTAVAMYMVGDVGWLGENVTGLQSLVWGFFLPTTLILHATCAINSVGHARNKQRGYRRFATDDQSVNNFWLSIITLGGGWHNNHHRYGGGARSGLAWWEFDATYFALRLLEMLGLVWALRPVPQQVLFEVSNCRNPDTEIKND